MDSIRTTIPTYAIALECPMMRASAHVPVNDSPCRRPVAAQSRPTPTTPHWRRRDWQIWRRNYLDQTAGFWRRAWVHDLNKSRRWLASVKDIAQGGMSLIVDEPLDSGHRVKVEVWSTSDTGPCRLVVRVLHVVPHGEGRWLVHCAFARDTNAFEGLQKVQAAC
jgi:hypothetical protein